MASSPVLDCLPDSRYRLGVIARTASDVIHHVGGWLFDQAMSGWAVTVMLTQYMDTRPLRILGADAVDLDSAFARSTADRYPDTLAVAADMYVDDVRVRRWMRMTRSDRFTDVVLWGLQTPCAGEDHVVCSIEHQLSAAARLFKSHALAAVGEPTATVEPTETLLTTTGRASKR